MGNPLDILFGPNVVSLLRRQPTALRRIAERVKPLLMAALHPDRNHEGGPEAAAEVSEAFAKLTSASAEEVQDFAEAFLARQREREEGLKRTLREAKNEKKGMERLLSGQDRKVGVLQRDLFKAREEAVRWILSFLGITGLPGVIPIGLVHQYRIVAEFPGQDSFFRVYEFDNTARLVRTTRTDNLEIARGVLPFKLSQKTYLELGSRNPESHPRLVGSTAEKVDRALGYKVPLAELVATGILQPHVAVGLYPVLVSVTKRIPSTEFWIPAITEIVPKSSS